MKKILIMLAVISVVLLIMSGCGKKDTQTMALVDLPIAQNYSQVLEQNLSGSTRVINGDKPFYFSNTNFEITDIKYTTRLKESIVADVKCYDYNGYDKIVCYEGTVTADTRIIDTGSADKPSEQIELSNIKLSNVWKEGKTKKASVENLSKYYPFDYDVNDGVIFSDLQQWKSGEWSPKTTYTVISKDIISDNVDGMVCKAKIQIQLSSEKQTYNLIYKMRKIDGILKWTFKDAMMEKDKL